MPAPDQTTTDRLDFAKTIARAAGELTLQYFRLADLEVIRKADESPVTAADRAAEQLLRKLIAEQFADDAILGEEFGESPGSTGYQWILDPIDGTKSFIHGVPLYTTLVAVLQGGEPLLGVIHSPATGETAFAARGGGCYYTSGNTAQPQPAKVSSVSRLKEGLLLTSEVANFSSHHHRDDLDAYLALQREARLARTWGDGYGYLMVATGRAEVMIDPIMNLWDAAPLLPIIEEAGGHFTNWQGTPTVHAGDSLATNGLVTEEVLGILRKTAHQTH
ncbi:MAG: histidinol-phosphatase [Pirellulales bacterium]|nr:histidinol-phosphatase [Pirellulales bacterium]